MGGLHCIVPTHQLLQAVPAEWRFSAEFTCLFDGRLGLSAASYREVFSPEHRPLERAARPELQFGFEALVGQLACHCLNHGVEWFKTTDGSREAFKLREAAVAPFNHLLFPFRKVERGQYDCVIPLLQQAHIALIDSHLARGERTPCFPLSDLDCDQVLPAEIVLLLEVILMCFLPRQLLAELGLDQFRTAFYLRPVKIPQRHNPGSVHCTGSWAQGAGRGVRESVHDEHEPALVVVGVVVLHHRVGGHMVCVQTLPVLHAVGVMDGDGVSAHMAVLVVANHDVG